MDEPIDNERKTQTRKEEVSGMAPNWISLATNGPFYTETDLKMSQIGLIFSQSDPIYYSFSIFPEYTRGWLLYYDNIEVLFSHSSYN